MRKTLIFLALIIPLCLFSQLRRVGGIKQFTFGTTIDKYCFYSNASYNYFLNKNFSIGADVFAQYGTIGLTDVFSINLNQIANYNFLQIRLHQYKQIYYYFSLCELAGSGWENIQNKDMKSFKNKLIYNLGLGINNEFYFNSKYAIGIRTEQRWIINSSLGNAYWLIIPEFKYNF